MPTPDCDPADKILSHYLHRLYRNDHSRSGRPDAEDFPRIFYECFGGLRNTSEARKAYLELVSGVSFPMAKALSELGVLAAGIKVRTQDELIAAILIALYLKREDLVAGACFDQLPAAITSTMMSGRKRIFESLRFFLMQQQDLTFLAKATIGDLQAYGSTRIGVDGYTHFCREILLFSLFGSLLGSETLEEIARKLRLVALDADFRLDKPEECLLRLLSSIFFATGRSFTEIKHKLGHTNPTVNAPPANPTQAPSDDRDSLSGDEGEEQDQDAEENEEQGMSGDADVVDYSLYERLRQLRIQIKGLKRELKKSQDPTRQQQLKDLKREAHGIEQALRRSKPLLPVSDDVCIYYEVLLEVLEAAKRCQERVQHGGKEVAFEPYLGLHLAFQLHSFLTESPYTARDRDTIAQTLARIIDSTQDKELGDALDVFAKIQVKNDLWGQRYRDILKHIVAQVCQESATAKFTSYAEDIDKKIRQAITDIGPDALYILPQRVSVASSMPAEELVLEYLKILETIDAHEADIMAHPGIATKYAVLITCLLRGLLLNPAASVRYCLERLEPVLGKERIGRFLALEVNLSNPNQLRALRDYLQEWVKGREIEFAITLIDRLYQLSADPDNPFPTIQPETQVSEAKVLRFFKQTYKRNISKKDGGWPPDEWEFMCYKLCYSPGMDRCKHVYERVAEDAVKQTTSPLSELYGSLLQEASDLVQKFKDWVVRCVTGSDKEVKLC